MAQELQLTDNLIDHNEDHHEPQNRQIRRLHLHRTKSNYRNNWNNALQLWNANVGPVATASINVDRKLGNNVVAIKDYDENKGIFDALVNAGIIEDLHQNIPVGYVEARLARLLI